MTEGVGHSASPEHDPLIVVPDGRKHGIALAEGGLHQPKLRMRRVLELVQEHKRVCELKRPRDAWILTQEEIG